MVKRCKKDEIEWLEFDLLKNYPEISHGVFLKQGGVSPLPYGSLNLDNHVGDDPSCVLENRGRVKKILSLPKLAFANQCHGINIKIIEDEADLDHEPCDAFITAKPKIGLTILHADCQAALIYDPKRKVIANIHSGWRGSVLNIYAATIKALQDRFHSHPEDLIVCISPSLGPEKSEFIHYKEEFPEAFHAYQIKPYHFDFWKISQDQLIALGIAQEHIEIAGLCTHTCDKDFFSYRRDKITGRHGTVIGFL